MKKVLLLLVLIAGATFGYSQDFDLIVKTNGDSIACSIDSVSNALIYFEMKYNNNWIHTQLNRDEVLEYKYNSINWKNHIYKPGTSYILPGMKPVISTQDLPKNGIYIGCNIFAIPVIYERLIPVGEKTAILAGVGAIQEWIGEELKANPVVKAGIIAGKGKHFFEGGLYMDFHLVSDHLTMIIPFLGYRYQAPGGFYLRGDFALFIPGISIGFSF
ncbi:MAG TPA: hypothetical protein PLV06_09455 [Bacteroidales bacterium]|nr:hypothetical protein [Bacteroidales bacterium]HPR12597.1 hypothetical protein [Bacteroidales bacterium]HRW86088.1 hypothetical protein [Bacteroidales bacterium]